MEDRLPLLKRLDVFVFKKIDEFRATTGYAKLLESYTSLEETEQKIAKSAFMLASAVIPVIILSVMWFANYSIKNDLEARGELVKRMQEIIAQNSAAGNLIATVASPTAILDQGQLSAQMNGVASNSGFDANKLKVTNFSAEAVSPELTRAEADFRFDGVATPQLMGLFTTMMGRERFRISAVDITRNSTTNQLEGTFHAVHFGQTLRPEDTEGE